MRLLDETFWWDILMRPFDDETFWWNILMIYFDETFWWDILMGHLRRHLMRHFDKTFWWDILMRNFDETFLWDCLMRHFEKTFWWDILSFLKGHFLFFWQRILLFLICFCFVCFSVCHTLFTLLKGLFAPTSQSLMSKLFRYSESLGKSNGKKWSQSWTFLLKNG